MFRFATMMNVNPIIRHTTRSNTRDKHSKVNNVRYRFTKARRFLSWHRFVPYVEHTTYKFRVFQNTRSVSLLKFKQDTLDATSSSLREIVMLNTRAEFGREPWDRSRACHVPTQRPLGRTKFPKVYSTAIVAHIPQVFIPPSIVLPKAKHFHSFTTQQTQTQNTSTTTTKSTQKLLSYAKMTPTIRTLCKALNRQGTWCTFTGEFSSIITFVTAPLSYTLRITDSSSADIVHVIKERENASNAFSISDSDCVTKLCTWVSDFQTERQQESICGHLKPAPQPDSTLLALLHPAITNPLQRFVEAKAMVDRRHLLDAVVSLFTPFGLQPMLDTDAVSFGAKELITNAYHPGPKIFRLKKPGFEINVRGGLDLSTCVTLLHARSHGAAQVAADRDRTLSAMLVEAGYVDDDDDHEDHEDACLPQKVLLYDLSKAEDRRALVERVLLMRDSVKPEKTSFEMGRWMGKQKSSFKGIPLAPCPRATPAAHAYYQRKQAGKGSGLRGEIKREDIEFGTREKKVKRSRRPLVGKENLLELVLWNEQDRVNGEILTWMEEKQWVEEAMLELTCGEDDEDDDREVEEAEPFTRPASPFKHVFSKRWTAMVEEDEEDGMNLGLSNDELFVS
jgi:hypothetical protein